jgi:hypothetical protein
VATLEQVVAAEGIELPVLASEIVETPVVKKKAGKKKRRRYRRRRGRPMNTAERDWYTWNHDFDTILHELVKNPIVNRIAPKTLVKRAEQFADAMLETQNRRKPPGVKSNGRF